MLHLNQFNLVEAMRRNSHQPHHPHHTSYLLPPAQSANHCASCHPGYYPEKGTCKAGYGPEVTEKTESRGPKLWILESGHLMGPISVGDQT